MWISPTVVDDMPSVLHLLHFFLSFGLVNALAMSPKPRLLKHYFSATCPLSRHISQRIATLPATNSLGGASVVRLMRTFFYLFHADSCSLIILDYFSKTLRTSSFLVISLQTMISDLLALISAASPYNLPIWFKNLSVVTSLDFLSSNIGSAFWDRLMRLTLSPKFVNSGSAFTFLRISVYDRSPYLKMMITSFGDDDYLRSYLLRFFSFEVIPSSDSFNRLPHVFYFLGSGVHFAIQDCLAC